MLKAIIDKAFRFYAIDSFEFLRKLYQFQNLRNSSRRVRRHR